MRLERGLSQADMARLTGIPERTYRRIETGETYNPGVRYLTNIAIVFGLDPETHLGMLCHWDMLEWQVFHQDGPKEPPPHEEYPGRFRQV